MRIGLFTDQYYPSVSGVVTSLKMLYEGLTEMGHECFIFTSFDESKVTDKEELKSKNVINIPGKPYPFKDLKEYRFTFKYKKFVKVVKEYNLDIIHLHTEYSISKLAIKAQKKLKIPMVHTLHTLWSDYFKYVSPFFAKHCHGGMLYLLKKLFTKPISKNATIEIVPTKKVYNQKETYALGDDVRIIPTGIELGRFYKSNFKEEEILELKKSLGIKEDQFVFLYIGRTSAEKNIPALINAYAKSCKGNDKTIFVIVGGGPELESLKELAKTLGVYEQMVFTDLVPWGDVPKYYQLGDIFVNASQSETQGLTYLEALASSIPLLVQRDDCIAEVVIDYYNGIYFDGIDDLALKMEEILKAPETLKKIKSNTFKSVENYSKEKYAENVYQIYVEAIEKYNALNQK